MATKCDVRRDYVTGLALVRKAMRAAAEEMQALHNYCNTLEDVNERLDDENSDYYDVLMRIRNRAGERMKTTKPGDDVLHWALEEIEAMATDGLKRFSVRPVPGDTVDEGGVHESAKRDPVGQR